MNSHATRNEKASSARTTKIHAGEIGREIRQHAQRRAFMAAITDAIQARGAAAEIDHDQKEGRERVDAEMRADPRQPDRKRHHVRRAAGNKMKKHAQAGHRGNREAEQIDRRRPRRDATGHNGDCRNDKEPGHAQETDNGRHSDPGLSRKLTRAGKDAGPSARAGIGDARRPREWRKRGCYFNAGRRAKKCGPTATGTWDRR